MLSQFCQKKVLFCGNSTSTTQEQDQTETEELPLPEIDEDFASELCD